jgi:hypothetical protein
MDESARNPALERLDVFVGEWTTEASFPLAPRGGGTGRTVFEWILDGQFLVQRSEVPHPSAPDSMAIIGPDPEHAAYTQHYFDSRGVVRVYTMTLADGTWELSRVSPDFSPLAFSQRFTGTFSDDGNVIQGRWESLNTGSNWVQDFDLTYTKVN